MGASKRMEVARATLELLAELGRYPTAREVAARAGVDPATVWKHRRSPAPPRKRSGGREDLVPGMIIVGVPDDPP